MHIPPSDLHVRIPSQDEIEAAPTITFAAFRRLAKRREWSAEYLVEQCRDHLDDPTETIRRVLRGATIPGHHDEDGKWVPAKHQSLDLAVLPYWPLIQLYQTHG
jgi:hypothetical protein